MEAIGATAFDALEVVKTTSSSDALTWALMQEKAKGKAKKEQSNNRNSVVRTNSLRSKNDSKVLKDGYETARRNKLGMVNSIDEEFELSTPIKAKRQSTGSSPGGTDISSDASIATDAEKDDTFLYSPDTNKPPLGRSISNASKKRGGFIKKMLRKTKSLRVPRSIDTADHGADEILRDLDLHSLQSSVGTRTILHKNTGHGRSSRNNKMKNAAVQKDPAVVLKRAARYKKKAQRLLREASEDGAANGKDPRDKEAIARKAYRYAAEARRLLDVVEKNVQAQAKERVEENALQISTPSRSEISALDVSVSDVSEITTNVSMTRTPPKVRVNVEDLSPRKYARDATPIHYSVSMFDDDKSVGTAHTSFSQKVEIDEHKRKMKELELFPKDEMKTSWGCSMGQNERREFYADETERIIQSFDSTPAAIDRSDTQSVMTYGTTATAHTTDSERQVREEHEQKMSELQLFTPVLMWNSMLESLTKKTVKEEEVVKVDNKATEELQSAALNEERCNDSVAEDGEEESMHMGNVCSAMRYNDMVDEDDVYFEGEGTFSDDSTDESTEDGTEYDDDTRTGDGFVLSYDEESDSDSESDDEDEDEDRRGILQRWIDSF
mmetsp:Transcript_8570/g.14245  ORF Transcript_8570/g.14245 Transcript_8570/m.14245 type:complete len:610 (-) Transcript_8570:142-1971(-)|eukprot:CAMPEP_0119004406 /NCGR_PEP_ID=MMETSP1176-20130426/1121_1 /TAXON_ID=265551 /ORGANISM="Synedropsis recta cf, Strain CCMP1620" /LENGTH=609 /DNA_ID=CAMNT_0006956105 /DNA_START=61 /DNA_END=1890 /DNA_ORIENTATION=+